MQRGTDVKQAARVLRDGGLVVYPTETLYGLGCDPFQDAAVERVFEVKGRGRELPLSVAFPKLSAAKAYVTITPLAKQLASAFLPGPLTLVLELTADGVDRLGAVTSSGTLAVRVPDGPLVKSLLEEFGPVTATSANLHGAPDPTTADAVAGALKDLVDYYLVDDRGVPGRPSTVVDARGQRPKVVRAGVVAESEIAGAARGA